MRGAAHKRADALRNAGPAFGACSSPPDLVPWEASRARGANWPTEPLLLRVAAACGLAIFLAGVISARARLSPGPQSKGE
jgi:hypothetical protein